MYIVFFFNQIFLTLFSFKKKTCNLNAQFGHLPVFVVILTHRPPLMTFWSSRFLTRLAKSHYPLSSTHSFPLSSLHPLPPSPHLHQQPILDECLVLDQLSHLFLTPTHKWEKNPPLRFYPAKTNYAKSSSKSLMTRPQSKTLCLPV